MEPSNQPSASLLEPVDQPSASSLEPVDQPSASSLEPIDQSFESFVEPVEPFPTQQSTNFMEPEDDAPTLVANSSIIIMPEPYTSSVELVDQVKVVFKYPSDCLLILQLAKYKHHSKHRIHGTWRLGRRRGT